MSTAASGLFGSSRNLLLKYNPPFNYNYNTSDRFSTMTQLVSLPVALPKYITSDFTTAANIEGGSVSYHDDFTIDSGESWALNDLTVIYCKGTFTCQGNGISATNTDLIRPVLQWPLEAGVGGTAGNAGTGKGSGGGGTANSGGARYNAGGADGGAGAGTRKGAGVSSASCPGALVVFCNTAVITGNITLNGSAGSNGDSTPLGGSGGGWGGSVIVFANSSITHSAGTITTAGGAGGAGSGTGEGGGGGGDSGLIWFFAPTITTAGGTRTATPGAGGAAAAGGGAGTNGSYPLMGTNGILDITGNPFI